MSSLLRRLISSRANAAKSTGPKSTAGKRRSSLNALRNGFRSQTVVLENESAPRFSTPFSKPTFHASNRATPANSPA